MLSFQTFRHRFRACFYASGAVISPVHITAVEVRPGEIYLKLCRAECKALFFRDKFCLPKSIVAFVKWNKHVCSAQFFLRHHDYVVSPWNLHHSSITFPHQFRSKRKNVLRIIFNLNKIFGMRMRSAAWNRFPVKIICSIASLVCYLCGDSMLQYTYVLVWIIAKRRKQSRVGWLLDCLQPQLLIVESSTTSFNFVN